MTALLVEVFNLEVVDKEPVEGTDPEPVDNFAFLILGF